MPVTTENSTATTELVKSVERWLLAFERAVSADDELLLANLFDADSYWRDLLALTWQIRTVSGGDAIASALIVDARRAKLGALRIDPQRSAPREVTRAGMTTIEAFFSFETAQGRGSGVLRLMPASPDRPNSGTLRAWTLHTTLDELTGFEEQIGKLRPGGHSHTRDFHGPNWLDQRKATSAYVDRDPVVLVVGGGQAGLAVAARLTQLQVDTLIVDREERIGDTWRKRYHALTLHNQVYVNHLPYMPFPPNWPVYIPKDKLAGWFEAYAESMELNIWTETEFEGGTYDEEEGCWHVVLRRADGTTRALRPRHIVMATGVSAVARMPQIPTLHKFGGTVLHSSQYKSGEAWRGKKALVIGTGTSAHDIAQELYAGGADVTLVQRGATTVVSIEPSGQLVYTLYTEGLPLEECDLISTSMPFALVRKSHILMTEQTKILDRDLHEGLQSKGFQLDFGEDGSGWQFKYLTRGGGFYFNVGCSDLIIEGKIGLAQYADISEFVAEGARLQNGELLAADLIVLATGYQGQEYMVRKFFGDEVANRVGPIWGFGEEVELRNMFKQTAQPGLWFIGGSIGQCRIYSKYLALQIKGCEEGLLPLSGAL